MELLYPTISGRPLVRLIKNTQRISVEDRCRMLTGYSIDDLVDAIYRDQTGQFTGLLHVHADSVKAVI